MAVNRFALLMKAGTNTGRFSHKSSRLLSTQMTKRHGDSQTGTVSGVLMGSYNPQVPSRRHELYTERKTFTENY